MGDIAITAVGADRPGIVAAITAALLDLGGNLADARAALLRGSFATVLVVSLPDDVSVDQVRAALAPVATELGLGVWIGPAAPPSGHGHDRCVISVYGADRPGIVHAVTAALAAHAINVVDLSSQVVGAPPIYALAIAADLPAPLVAADVERILAPVAASHRVEVSVTDDADGVM